MSVKYDIESLVGDLQTFLQANLNTKLAAIDTDKGNDFVTPLINSNAYFFQNLLSEIASYTEFVFYRIDKISSDPVYAATSKKYSIQVMVIATDSDNNPNIMKQMLRYQRALTELFESNFSSVCPVSNIQISDFTPFPIQLANRADIDQVIGVTLEVYLA